MARARGARILRGVAAAALLAWLGSAHAARADEYDAHRAGHPLRIAAYALHPVGVALDWLIFRPAHYIGSLPVVRTIFGHDVEGDTDSY